jgi:hypothetical protein
MGPIAAPGRPRLSRLGLLLAAMKSTCDKSGSNHENLNNLARIFSHNRSARRELYSSASIGAGCVNPPYQTFLVAVSAVERRGSARFFRERKITRFGSLAAPVGRGSDAVGLTRVKGARAPPAERADHDGATNPSSPCCSAVRCAGDHRPRFFARLAGSWRGGACWVVPPAEVRQASLGRNKAGRLPLATDNAPLAPELSAGIAGGKSAKSNRRQVHRSAASALTDGRSSGGFTPEATVAAGRASMPELAV